MALKMLSIIIPTVLTVCARLFSVRSDVLNFLCRGISIRCQPMLSFAQESLWSELQKRSVLMHAFLQPFQERNQADCGQNFINGAESNLNLAEQQQAMIISDFPPVHSHDEAILLQAPRLHSTEVTYTDIAMEAKWLKQSYCNYIGAWMKLSHSTLSNLARNTIALQSASRTLQDLVGEEAVRSIAHRLDKASDAKSCVFLSPDIRTNQPMPSTRRCNSRQDQLKTADGQGCMMSLLRRRQ